MSKKFVPSEMVSLAEYARRTGFHPQTIYQRLRSNLLPGAIKNADGDWRIPAPSSNVMKPADLTPNERRAERYDSEFIACIRHPERRCNRSDYISARHRRCATCKRTRLNGTKIPAYERACRQRDYNRSMEKALHWGRSSRSLQGFKLFARLTGFNYGVSQ